MPAVAMPCVSHEAAQQQVCGGEGSTFLRFILPSFDFVESSVLTSLEGVRGLGMGPLGVALSAQKARRDSCGEPAAL